MEIINLIFDVFNSPIFWLIGVFFFLGYVWVPKTSDDEVLAAHINDLQTKKLDNAGAETVTGDWTIQARWVFLGDALPLSFRNDGDCAVWWHAYSNNQQDNPTIKQVRGRGTEVIPVIVQQNDPCGEWTSYGYDGVQVQRCARIYMDIDGVPGAGDMPGRIDFEVTPSGNVNPIVKMSLKQDGLLWLGGNLQLIGTCDELTMSDSVVLVENQLKGTTQTIADDGFYSFTTNHAIGMLLIFGRVSTYDEWFGMVSFKTTATEYTQKVFGHANLTVTTGALNGTTGADGDLTISAANDGKVYIENRTGGSKNFCFVILGGY